MGMQIIARKARTQSPAPSLNLAAALSIGNLAKGNSYPSFRVSYRAAFCSAIMPLSAEEKDLLFADFAPFKVETSSSHKDQRGQPDKFQPCEGAKSSQSYLVKNGSIPKGFHEMCAFPLMVCVWIALCADVAVLH